MLDKEAEEAKEKAAKRAKMRGENVEEEEEKDSDKNSNSGNEEEDILNDDGHGQSNPNEPRNGSKDKGSKDKLKGAKDKRNSGTAAGKSLSLSADDEEENSI